MKIALSLIVKGTDDEAKLLDRCLENVSPHVDGIFVTITHLKGEQPNKACFDVAVKYNAFVSYFTWEKDFALARNFNFSQIPKDYDYILWCDADDVWRGLDTLKPTIEKNLDVDAFAFWYLYEFDEHKNPVVAHNKTQVVRNDGCTRWVGEIHEELQETRSLRVKFIEGIDRMHFTTEPRVQESRRRNLEISRKQAKLYPNDPRSDFNLGNSYMGMGETSKAIKSFKRFIKRSQAPLEVYISRIRLATSEHLLGNKEEAIQHLQIAIGMQPDMPDAYNELGYRYFDYRMYDEAEKYLLLGLVIKPKYHKMIAYNPRDYDFNPMMALAKVYFQKARPDLALPMLEGCLKINPNEKTKNLVTEMKMENERLGRVVSLLNEISAMDGNKEKVLAKINSLPVDLQSHPAVRRIYNTIVVKGDSSGKDIAYYCGMTVHEWNPEMAKTKGVGGSEEAVMNLAKQWVKMGYNVTVYNSCGLDPMVCDGVQYRPWWYYNPRDKYDITVLWRSPMAADHEINTNRLFVDMHDVIPAGEFNEKRLARINKIFVKTEAHRVLFPNVPDEKMVIISNGQDPLILEGNIEKDPYLLVNTSSPDRSLDVLPKLFKKVKERVPRARLQWCYGWEIFDNAFDGQKDKMEWKESVVKEMSEAGIEVLGRLSQAEAGKVYQRGRVLAYPTEFYEIDCISVKKAQACGCIPVTTDFAALKETNAWGIKVHSKKTIENWSKPYQFHYGIEDEEVQQAWVDEVVRILETNPENMQTYQMQDWAKRFTWDKIAGHWADYFVIQ